MVHMIAAAGFSFAASHTIDRTSHAPLDLASRRLKASKVERLLGLDGEKRSLRILEVGCGSGGISHYFASPPRRHRVDAVDVVDVRVVRDGFAFQLVTGTSLPFENDVFDVVMSNHVIEHVGVRSAQLTHLQEMRRVMKPGGMGYLAVPNRWRLIEPHYRLPFLSVLPRPLRSPYVRLTRRGDVYDCEPLAMRTLERMFRETGFRFQRLGSQALRATLDLEHPGSMLTRLVHHLPRGPLTLLEPGLPTLIYRLGRVEQPALLRS